MLMTLAIFLLMLICLQLTVSISIAWRQRKALAQNVALLEQRVREIEREKRHRA
jgi:cell division protein FtsL